MTYYDTIRYPRLNRISPYLYNKGGQTVYYLNNLKFIVKNMRYIRMKDITTNQKLIEEYNKELKAIEHDERRVRLTYPMAYKVTRDAGLAIYSIIRHYRPGVVLETGVANGFSTRLILAALNKNNYGKLISVEINSNVGCLLDKMDKRRWKLVVGKPESVLKNTVRGLENIDVFLHDSNHAYKNMTMEFETISKKLGRKSIVMSDDINPHGAFMEFAKKKGLTPIIIPTRKKVFGVLRMKDRSK